MLSHETKVRIRYVDTDRMGVVYHGNYARFYEIGRVEALRSLGMTYKQLEDEENLIMPVTTMNIRFLRPAHYDDLITVKSTLVKLPTDKLIFKFEIYNEDGKLLNSADIRLCFLDKTTHKRSQSPERFLKLIRPYFMD